ncbi:hypothetical protein [Streptomyces sp. NBC_01589]|uniref:hypothetical protein n=1 Tax=unclassified Streptomyces TaxID=2593676 RepID=UPI003867707A
MTLTGFQKAAERVRALRDQGDEEAARMLGLDPDDPVRWEYARCLQIEAFHDEWYESEF